ncbi:MAG: lipopolysaccharide heptosyltransferase II [Gammaproteobacteria bacterium]|nr:lipopolysaccharide heptosyltransferase II [Gammaproteobacteria bacterium]
MSSKETFLIIAPSWIGDLIISQSLIKYLKKEYLDCQIDIIVRPELVKLAKMMPEVQNIYSLDIEHKELGLIKRHILAKEIKKYSYSTSIILPNSFKSAIIPWLANVPLRVGYNRELRLFLLNKKYSLIKHKDSMVNRYLKLADGSYSDSIRPSLVIDRDLADSIGRKYLINNSKKNIVLCPEAEYGSAKRWPTNKWVQLANFYKEKNYNVYLLGKNKNLDIKYNSVLKKDSVISLLGKTSLEEATYLLSLVDLVITNDSGLMHITASVNTNLISIFGSSSPFYTPPLMKDQFGEVVYKALKCSPCFKRECPLQHLNCLNHISAEEILNKSIKYLS